MLFRKILLLASLVVSIANCETNNIPDYIRSKSIDCSRNGTYDGDCEIKLVVEAATSMTYYSEDAREIRGYRAIFNSNGKLEILLEHEGVQSDISEMNPGLQPPIQTDGEFRPIITINGQMPGPTIIANENQRLIITVYNELKNVEGISIHWHGIHHRSMDTQNSDGVAYITQKPILPNQNFVYNFLASPKGTHWYHAHSGAQRTDGLYGALIVNDILPEDNLKVGEDKITDRPENTTLILMDWQREASVELFQTIGTSLRYWQELQTMSTRPNYQLYYSTRGPDYTEVGPIPFWSGIINDKGRHFNDRSPNIANPSCDNLNCFTVKQGNIYRFRLIGAQALYPLRFSIQGHTFTVVATDGALIVPIPDVNYLIINSGERYDILVNTTNKAAQNYWIFAETLEDRPNSRYQSFYNPINLHRAEAILHYAEYSRITISDYNVASIKTWTTCTTSNKCKAVNCPFSYYSNKIDCINADQFEAYPEDTAHVIPPIVYSATDDTLFFNFGFDGENSTAGSSVDGVNFRFPTYPPLTEYTDFQNSKDVCPKRGCDHEIKPHCACTQVIDISDRPRDSLIEMVITNREVNESNPNGTSHPVHLHGHYFYVVHIGYPTLDTNGQFKSANDNISCTTTGPDNNCQRDFINVEGGDSGMLKQTIGWTDGVRPNKAETNRMSRRLFARKDTVIVPFGGFTIIRFIVDNPGWWFLHCHIEIHQLEGMAAVIKELQPQGGGSTYSTVQNAQLWVVVFGAVMAVTSTGILQK